MTVLSGAIIEANDLVNIVQPPVAMLRQTSAQTFGTSGTYAALLFDTDDFDSANGHSTSVNTSRYTAVVAGMYECSGGTSFVASATGRRLCRWTKNGVVVSGSLSSMPANASVNGLAARTVLVQLNVGEYVELQAMQESGGSLATFVANPEFESTMVVRWFSN